ncbi:hypothetical protein, partial [Acinetobacter baumannii]
AVLSRAQQSDGFVTPENIEQQTKCLTALRLQINIALQHQTGIFTSDLQKISMRFHRGEFKARRAGLTGARQL